MNRIIVHKDGWHIVDEVISPTKVNKKEEHVFKFNCGGKRITNTKNPGSYGRSIDKWVDIDEESIFDNKCEECMKDYPYKEITTL